MKVSCVTASYVADELGYTGTIDWQQAGERARRRPILEGVDHLLGLLAPAKLDGIEIWYPHVWPANITPALGSAIRGRLSAAGMVCCACAGGLGDPNQNPDSVEEFFQTAQLLKTPLFAGNIRPGTAGALTKLCERYRIRVAFENHSQCTASEILDVIEGGNEWIGVCLDTGNLVAQGGDPVRVLRQLGSTILHVHLKDLASAGSLECVALGTGIVDIDRVVQELKRSGYDGWLSIELESSDHDPTEEILASARRIRKLWNR